ncbi:facilitated trehalose transporter Tret1-like [Galleria mellonella]|uniref:Facilitated trehalose transporter Tret1-like n=1 Tax=Galleria mellonella TaxID=7137 RepID=A0A6J1X334_GALME|nr:facilitated trehalose transporter Tret1-like [Galleria mellonella]
MLPKVTHIYRQCLVTAGVSLSMMEHCLVGGFSAILLPQLCQDKTMVINSNTETWIASIYGISLIPGALVTPFILNRYGRRKANLISCVIMIIGWLCTVIANDAEFILFARFIQGVALGISSLSGPILVGEYTTPRYRGGFLTMMTLSLSLGSMTVHTLGSVLTWRKTAMFCLGLTVFDAIIIMMSPETPVFLATRERYDECRKVFHWLRGLEEEEELEAMIKADIYRKESKTNKEIGLLKKIKTKSQYMLCISKKSEFYKPLIAMLHLDVINVWSGSMMMDIHGIYILHKLTRDDINVYNWLIGMDVVRLLAKGCGIFVHSKFKRRPMVIMFVGLNILVYLLTAAFSYAKDSNVFYYAPIAVALVYFLIITVGMGIQPLVNIIAGEIFPLEYKGVSSMIIVLFLAVNITVKMKTLPYLFSSIGLSGTYCLYSSLIVYALVVVITILPETKDETLQHIEETYWKKPDYREKLSDEVTSC